MRPPTPNVTHEGEPTLEVFFDHPGHILWLLEHPRPERRTSCSRTLRRLLAKDEERVAVRVQQDELPFRLHPILMVLNLLVHKPFFGPPETPSETLVRQAVVRVRNRMLRNPHLDPYVVVKHLIHAPRDVLRHPAVLLELTRNADALAQMAEGQAVLEAAQHAELRSGALARLAAGAKWKGFRAEQVESLPLEGRRFIATHVTAPHLRQGLRKYLVKEGESLHGV